MQTFSFDVCIPRLFIYFRSFAASLAFAVLFLTRFDVWLNFVGLNFCQLNDQKFKIVR